jgi:phosphate starvation-inducible membrane PsiE
VTSSSSSPATDVPAFADRGLRLAEQIVYVVACVLLLAGAVALLIKAGYDLATGLGDDGVDAVASSVLDSLLLVFVFVELLSAVRTTLREGELLAEPFLLVGVIATIKELVVTANEARDKAGNEFEEAAIEIGVLSGLLLVLAVALFLVRRKEREPEEG